jgi:hypothetical protein
MCEFCDIQNTIHYYNYCQTSSLRKTQRTSNERVYKGVTETPNLLVPMFPNNKITFEGMEIVKNKSIT